MQGRALDLLEKWSKTGQIKIIVSTDMSGPEFKMLDYVNNALIDFLKWQTYINMEGKQCGNLTFDLKDLPMESTHKSTSRNFGIVLCLLCFKAQVIAKRADNESSCLFLQGKDQAYKSNFGKLTR